MALNLTGGLAPEAENNVVQTFSDATAGRSMQLYWCCATTDSAGVDYVLVRDSGTSLPVSTIAPSPTVVSIDFDITINKPTTFAGIATIDCKTGTNGGGAAVNTFTLFKLYHYDGSTETQIGTVQTANLSGAGQTHITKLTFNVTRKLFGIGHTLRLTADISGGIDATKGSELYHDPNTSGSELKLWMPIVNME